MERVVGAWEGSDLDGMERGRVAESVSKRTTMGSARSAVSPEKTLVKQMARRMGTHAASRPSSSFPPHSPTHRPLPSHYPNPPPPHQPARSSSAQTSHSSPASSAASKNALRPPLPATRTPPHPHRPAPSQPVPTHQHRQTRSTPPHLHRPHPPPTGVDEQCQVGEAIFAWVKGRAMRRPAETRQRVLQAVCLRAGASMAGGQADGARRSCP